MNHFHLIFQTKNVVGSLNGATDKVFKAMASQSSLGEEPVNINTPAMALTAVKKTPAELAGASMNVGGGTFAMPKMASAGNESDEDPVDMKVGCGHLKPVFHISQFIGDTQCRHWRVKCFVLSYKFSSPVATNNTSPMTPDELRYMKTRLYLS